MLGDHPIGINDLLVIIQQGEKGNLSSQGSLEFQSQVLQVVLVTMAMKQTTLNVVA